MKKLLIKITASLVVAASTFAAASSASAYVSVNGYWKSNGTYVAPHIRTSPDSSIYNNFSYWK
jgi:hypothetical protein